MESQTTILQQNGTTNPAPAIKRTDHTASNKMIYARSPSPAHTMNGAQLKPNQVSTVLLYGIPIVSLYIEAQERLCLAQISNTLLKQFSYNEIHNRRVALGITCVQCTPVQLEILRRAGAMPVSSRRCGMITRREAERLCKSFLGDNSPPRLPDDFSFGVLHECAWGCRGAFLPSRYNSSRAKCIKCTFCGLFFSPNKFIFHSHRLGPNDKYVQPDAANFNSWRRHLKLSGNPPDDVAHAWEDVKAMFNGGTRKRMLSSPISMHRRGGGSGAEREARDAREADEITNSPAKRQKEVSSVIAKAPAHFPIRPINIHPTPVSTQQATTPTPVTPPNLANLALRVPAPAATAFPPDLPFNLSRSFMIDYMWHQHHQQQQTISSTTSTPPAKPNQFQFPPYSALSWINKPPSSFLFKPNGAGANSGEDKPTFNHFSAFKPVVNMRLEPLENSSVNVLNNPNTQSPASSTSSYNHTTTSSTNHSDEELAPIKVLPKKRSMHRLNMNEVTSDHSVPTGGDTIDIDSNCSESNIKEQLTSDDENEMVDIETTEDDVHIHNLQPFKYSEEREADEKCLDLENNNNNLSDDLSEASRLSKKHRASEVIKNVQDEMARRSPSYNNNNNNNADWSINLKKEVYFNPPYFNPFKSN